MKTSIQIPFTALQEKVSAMPPAHKALLYLGTFLVLGVAFYFFQYQGQETVIRRLKSNIETEQKKLATLKEAQAQVAVLEKDLAKSKEEFLRLLSLLPDQKEIPGLLEKISELGAEVGLENILFQPQAEQTRDFYAAIPIRLDLVGSYHKLGLFLDRISKLHRILKVDNFSMTRQKDSSTLQVNCTVMTYRFVEQAVQADKAPPKK